MRAHPLRLSADLIGKPLWLAGIAPWSRTGVGALALGGQDAHVSLVEPLLTTNLLFALGTARSLSDEQLRWREWAGAVVLTTGIPVFLMAAQPSTGGGRVGWRCPLPEQTVHGAAATSAQRRCRQIRQIAQPKG